MLNNIERGLAAQTISPREAATLANAATRLAAEKQNLKSGDASILPPLQKNLLRGELEDKLSGLKAITDRLSSPASLPAPPHSLPQPQMKPPARKAPVPSPTPSPTPDADSESEGVFEKAWDKLRSWVAGLLTQNEATSTPISMDEKEDARWAKIEAGANGKVKDTLYDWSRGKNTDGMKPYPFPAPVPVIKDVPYPSTGEKACVFYTNTPGAAFKKQAEYQRKVLESMGYEVELIQTDKVNVFQTEWNNMDPKTTTAVIISHCNGMSLIFEHNSKTNAISANGLAKDDKTKLPPISGLNGPEIAELYIYACNAGVEELLASRGTNVADAFRDLANVDTVYAYDGSVGFGPPSIFRTTYEPRLSYEQNYDDVFTNFSIPAEYGKSGASGFLEYDSDD